MTFATIIKGNKLFWKITAVFTGLLILLGIVFVWIASTFSKSYYTAAHQELYGNIAQHLASFTRPIKNGRPDTSVTHDIIHSTMVANPSVEVYLLDTAGNITDYVVPDATVQKRKVNITAVKQWLEATGKRPMGDNPKQPSEQSIFSAAPVYENGKLAGYVYAVLSSEKQKEILSALNSHFYARLSSDIFFAALLAAFFVGVIIFFLMTNSISKIVHVVSRFKEGDYSARIDEQMNGDLKMLGTTFNEMADVVVNNINSISATNKFRQELIANVSHDLRTPLAIMQGYVETLMIKKESLSPESKEEYLSVVYDSSRKLSRLVEHLFQYAKLEANFIVPEKETFQIGELAADVLMSYQLMAEKKKVSLKLKTSKNLPAVFADIALTERVLQNLLDNALKYTPERGCITIELVEAEGGVSVQVADTGAGIAADQQSFIFERYKQLDGGKLSNKGMGLGLAIVKKILELHQCSIEVRSTQGSGTVFGFTLPVGV